MCLTHLGSTLQSPLCRSDCALTLSLSRLGEATGILAGDPGICVFGACRRTLAFGPCALLCADPESQLTRNGRVALPLLSQNGSESDFERHRCAASAPTHTLRLHLFNESFVLWRSHWHLAGDPSVLSLLHIRNRRSSPSSLPSERSHRR